MNEYDVKFTCYDKCLDCFSFEVFGCTAIELSKIVTTGSVNHSLGVTEIEYLRPIDTLWLKMPMAINGDYETVSYDNAELKNIITNIIAEVEKIA